MKIKNRLEIEVRKRTRELAKAYLSSQVKERTRSLDLANIELTEKYKELQKLNRYTQKQNQGFVRKSLDLTETRAQLEDKYYELESLNREINKQNKELIRRTIELTETKAKLEDKNIDLTNSYLELEKQRRDLLRKTIELTDIKSQLEDRTVKLEEANKEILSMLKLKTEFINQAAHDLRTPLTPIMTLIPLLKPYLKDNNALHNLDIIFNNANYLNRIVKELLLLAKTKTSRFEYMFEYIELCDLIDEVLSNNETVFKSQGITIVRKYEKGLPKVQLDRFKMIEVIQNIFANTLKFSHGKGILTISIKKIDKFINVRMSDTGIGMSKNTLIKVFEEFFKADPSRHGEGVGLGLSICKRIIEKHNGRIWAESKGIGKGSSIIFEVPVNQPER